MSRVSLFFHNREKNFLRFLHSDNLETGNALKQCPPVYIPDNDRDEVDDSAAKEGTFLSVSLPDSILVFVKMNHPADLFLARHHKACLLYTSKEGVSSYLAPSSFSSCFLTLFLILSLALFWLFYKLQHLIDRF